jgi:hypothetical protein
MVAQAANLNAMFTYEDSLLGLEVFSALSQSMEVHMAAQAARASKVSKAKPVTNPRNQNSGGLLRISCFNLTIMFVDDYNGRWIPLLQLGVTYIRIMGNTGAAVKFVTDVSLNLEYFHNATSSWLPVLEPCDLQVQYTAAKSDTGTHWELHFHLPDDMATFHVSSAVIDSLTHVDTGSAYLRTDEALGHGRCVPKSRCAYPRRGGQPSSDAVDPDDQRRRPVCAVHGAQLFGGGSDMHPGGRH